jgi:hypothetical protein
MSQGLSRAVLDGLSYAASRPVSTDEVVRRDDGDDPELGHCISYIVELGPGHRVVFPVWDDNPDPEDIYEEEE